MLCYLLYKWLVINNYICSERCFKNLFLSYFFIFLLSFFTYFSVDIDIFDLNKYLYVFIGMIILGIDLLISCIWIKPLIMTNARIISQSEEIPLRY